MPPSDKPDDALLADDGKLDRWYENFIRQHEREAGRKSGDGRYPLLGQAPEVEDLMADPNNPPRNLPNRSGKG